MKPAKLVVIGLDCVPPKLVFDLWKEELPNLSRLIDHGTWGNLRSSTPPITVPAWMCMVTGKDPGQLGIYGFRERDGNSYTKSRIADSSYVKEKTVWDIVGQLGKKSIILGVPPTYPPKKINGVLVSDFLTPSTKHTYTYPKNIAQEIKNVVGEYLLDTKFRTEDRKHLLKEISLMTKKRFKVANYLLKHKPWDFFMMVEIGTDRIHHAYWKYFDATHRAHDPHNQFKDAILNYYRLIDKQIGQLLKEIPKETIVLVVSDHGAKKMDGAFCINEWLIQEGYLVLNKYPNTVMPLEEADVNWSRTRAWAWGGYYGRVFLNVKGRDPEGLIEKNQFEKERTTLMKKLKSVTDEKGNPLKNSITTPERLYKKVNGNPSDIFTIFGDLAWRAAGTIGHKTLWIFDNDTGPDDAVHDWDGIFIMYDPQHPKSRHVKGMVLYDVASIILSKFGINTL